MMRSDKSKDRALIVVDNEDVPKALAEAVLKHEASSADPDAFEAEPLAA